MPRLGDPIRSGQPLARFRQCLRRERGLARPFSASHGVVCDDAGVGLAHRLNAAVDGGTVVHTERFTSKRFEHGIAHAYRLTHLDPYHLLGTLGRDDDFDLSLATDLR